jgi:protocatechuate 4,5-dioxygenase beta chain
MSEIVGAFALPHTPFFPAVVAGGGPVGEALAGRYARVARAFAAAEPDVVVFFLPDHFADNFEAIPIFEICVADAGSGPCDNLDVPQRRVPIDARLGARLQQSLVAAGFDLGCNREPRLDHSSIVPLSFLTPKFDLPIVPIRISTFVRPLPSAGRCHDLGRAVRRALEEDGEDRRVAILATGNFSLDIGGPRMADAHYTGITDPDWVRRVCTLLEAGAVPMLVEEARPEQIDKAGAEAGELLLWCALLGTFDPRPATYVEPQPEFGQAFAAWELIR